MPLVTVTLVPLTVALKTFDPAAEVPMMRW
jgi:hypothetical protein